MSAKEDLSSDFHRKSLLDAITSLQLSLVKTLLEKGIYPNFVFLGTTPLHTAVKVQSNEIIEALVDAGADINRVARYGRTPLHVAAIHGHVEQLRCLISNGANVNLLDEDGNTALVCNAVVNSKSLQLACLKLLFDAGTDPSIPNKNNKSIVGSIVSIGGSIYPVATDFYHYMMTKKLIVKALNADPKSHSLCLDSESFQRVLMKNAFSALRRNDANELARILPGIKDVELKFSGVSLLHHAMDAKVDHDVNDVIVYPMMDVLFKHGVNVDVMNSSKITALHLACAKSQLGKARHLLSRGANMDAKDVNGDTPLHMAMNVRAFECVELLLQSGANPKTTNMFGLTFGSSVANEPAMTAYMSWTAQRSAYRAIEEIKLMSSSEAPAPSQKILASAKP